MVRSLFPFGRSRFNFPWRQKSAGSSPNGSYKSELMVTMTETLHLKPRGPLFKAQRGLNFQPGVSVVEGSVVNVSGEFGKHYSKTETVR